MQHILLSGIVGSRAYGLAGPDSDTDRLGIGTYDTEKFFALADPKDSLVSTAPDVTYHEARKAAKLLLAANPTMTELLWLPDDLYEIRTVLGDTLIGIRSSFLSADRVRTAYMGYATQQFKRLLTRGDGSFSSDTRKRTAKHARHLMRLAEQGIRLYTTGSLQVQLEDPGKFIDFGDRVAEDPEHARVFMADAESRYDTARTCLPPSPYLPNVENWLMMVRDYYYIASEGK